MTNATEREELARKAFAGGLPVLMDLLLERAGYEMGGVRWPSNGMTLAECIALTQALTDEDIACVLALS